MRFWLSVIVALLIATSDSGVLAQEQPPQGFETFRAEDDARRRLQTVRALMRQQDYLAAADLLQTIDANLIGQSVAYNLLRTCYEQMKAWPRLADLAEARIADKPDDFQAHADLALAKTQLQEPEAAEAGYLTALSLANSDAEYQRALQGLVDIGREELVLTLVDSLAATMDRPGPLLLQRGLIMERRKDYAAAARQFFEILDDTTRLATTAERKLLELLRFEESAEVVEATLMEPVEQSGNARALRLLSDHYLAQGDVERAFILAVRQCELEANEGREMARFLKACRDRKEYEGAVQAARYILDNFPQTPVLSQTYFTYAEVLARLGRLDEAAVVYDSAVVKLVRDQDKAEAMFRHARMYYDQRNDPGTALTYIDSLVRTYPRGVGYLQALLLRPHCFLRMGQLDSARVYFDNLAKQRLTEQSQEEVVYHLGMIDFLEKHFDSAAVAFDRMLVQYPQGLYINDALRLQMLMTRAEGSPELLEIYADAAAFELRRMIDSTVARFESLADHDNQALTDIALHNLCLITLDAADTTAALGYSERLIDDLPESYWTPYAMKLRADLLMARRSDPEEARRLYRELLEQHPNYPFIEEVRAIMRDMAAPSDIG